MLLKKLGNYNLFLFSNSLASFALGLFVPFWILFLRDFGGTIEQFGLSIGLMMLAQSAVSYIAGKYSDKLGRKIFLISSGFALVGVTYAYTLITSVTQLYILQVINGIIISIQTTTKATFLGDITKRVSRGTQIGKYYTVIGITGAMAIMGGGFLVGQFGFEIIFYITGAIIFVSTLVLFRINERSIVNKNVTRHPFSLSPHKSKN